MSWTEMKTAKEKLLARLQESTPQPQWLFAVPSTREGRALAPQFKPVEPNVKRWVRTPRPFTAVRTVNELLQSHKDPRVVLLEMAETHVADLAAMLNCSLLDAWQEKRLAAVAVLPYISRKQPVEIDLSTKTQVDLTIVTDGVPQLDLAADEVEVVPNSDADGDSE